MSSISQLDRNVHEGERGKSQNNELVNRRFIFLTILNNMSSLFVLPRCFFRSPAWRFCITLMTGCKGPIKETPYTTIIA